MTWLVYLLYVLLATFILALTGCLGKTAKRHSRSASRRVWKGFKWHTTARWRERRAVSRGKSVAKRRKLRVLKSQPVIYRVSEQKYEHTIPQCGADTGKGTACTRQRTQLKNGVILEHCWQHPKKRR